MALTHLHADHVGWVGDATGRPVFPNAKFVLGLGDWEYFMSRDDALEPHIRESLQWLDGQGRVVLQEGETEVAPGITRLSPRVTRRATRYLWSMTGGRGCCCWGTPFIVRSSSATPTGRPPLTWTLLSPGERGKPYSEISSFMAGRPSAAISPG